MNKYEWRKPTAEQRQWIMNMKRDGHLLTLQVLECQYLGAIGTAAILPNPEALTLEIRLGRGRTDWPKSFPLWPEDPSDLGHGPLVDEARARIEAGEFDVPWTTDEPKPLEAVENMELREYMREYGALDGLTEWARANKVGGEAHIWKKPGPSVFDGLPTATEIMEARAKSEAVAEAKENQARLREKKDRLERLRDEFAMAALTGLASRDISQPTLDAQYCYTMADAMLKAREGK